MSLRRLLNGSGSRGKLKHWAWKLIQQELHEAEQTMTPADYVDVLKQRSGTLNALGAAFASDTTTGRMMLDCETLKPFQRRQVSALVDLYAHPETPGRNLLVVFTGRGLRPMIAVPSFLQSLDSKAWSVLMLRDPEKMQYRNGIPEYARTFSELVKSVKEDFSDYDRKISIGTSMGGFAAIRFALAGAVDRGISVGGRFPQDGLALLTGAKLPDAFDPICACLPATPRDLIYTFAGHNRGDRVAANAAARLTGGTILRVDEEKDHLLLYALMVSGVLEDFLATLLDDAPVPGRRVQPAG